MQTTLEQAIARVTNEAVHVVGSGRTDAGAHATCQVIAFSTDSSLSEETLCRAMNAYLPPEIAVTSATEAPLDFHPRYDAHSRVYRYLIWNRPIRSPFWLGRAAHVKPRLDVQRMSRAVRQLEGHHDFSAFVPVNQPGNRERTVYRATCWREGDLVVIELEASGFMRQMVRSVVGTLIRVGREKLDVDGFRAILLSGQRRQAGDTAPAEGLYLVGVRYGRTMTDESNSYPVGVLTPGGQLRDRSEETR